MKNIRRIANWYIIFMFCFPFLVFQMGCRKLIAIDPPASTITTTEVFSDSADAASAIAGIYTEMINTSYSPAFANGGITLTCGMSADELLPFVIGNDPTQVYTNSLLPTNGIITSLWNSAYTYIYQTNASIAGLESSANLSQSVKNQFDGEAKFLRAFYYFYLVNLYGDIPLVTTINFKSNSLISRASSTEIYNNIISDLKDAQSELGSDYSFSQNNRVRANKWAATALLARVYLYLKDWKDAEAQSSLIINNSGLFGLNANLNQVFFKNTNEAILQWNLNTAYFPYTATTEGYTILPARSSLPPAYYINPSLISAFEPGDQRRTVWIDSSFYSGITYYYPYKYKIGTSNFVSNGNASEYYMVLRLAEQYLIRAEAEAEGAGGGLGAAISDLNIIRNRAGLGNTTSSSSADVLSAILQERKIELFAEWGNRWLDLKRSGNIDSVMEVAAQQKGGTWNTFQQLYPIPFAEITLDPNLTQNQGY